MDARAVARGCARARRREMDDMLRELVALEALVGGAGASHAPVQHAPAVAGAGGKQATSLQVALGDDAALPDFAAQIGQFDKKLSDASKQLQFMWACISVTWVGAITTARLFRHQSSRTTRLIWYWSWPRMGRQRRCMELTFTL